MGSAVALRTPVPSWRRLPPDWHGAIRRCRGPRRPDFILRRPAVRCTAVVSTGSEGVHLTWGRSGGVIYAASYFPLEITTATPYFVPMHTVLWTSIFLTQAKRCGLSEDEIEIIENVLSEDPLAGDIMVGSGGARKLRHPGYGGGKSGGYRTIHYYGGEDVPVFLLSVFGKGAKANLSKAERNELAQILPKIADAYRQNVKNMAAKLRHRNDRRSK